VTPAMGLIDRASRGKFVDRPTRGVHAGGDVITTSLDRHDQVGPQVLHLADALRHRLLRDRVHAVSFSHYDIARASAPRCWRFSPRQSDLMFVARTIVDKQAPVLKTIYDQMPEPKWVISMGVCACVRSASTARTTPCRRIDEIIPLDVYVPGCPPSPEALSPRS